MNVWQRLLTWCIGFVWLINGLWAKLLHGVPRHEAIVARFFGAGAAPLLTGIIGAAEVAVAVCWFIGSHRRLQASLQILLVIVMNTLEAVFARDLLLWGGWNAIWAILFCGVIWYCSFVKTSQPGSHAFLS